MSFFGRTFIFAGVPSEKYNLLISTSDGGDTNVTMGTGVEPILEKIYKRPVPYFYGVDQSPTLSFDIEIYSEQPLDADKAEIISSWLFGQMTYKKLIIVQNDMQSVYFNCFLIDPQKKINGNQIVGFTATVLCDAPWGWTNEKTKSYTYTSDNIATDIILNIQTNNNFYTYPTIIFTMNVLGGFFKIINNSDNGRIFEFTGLTNSETITVKNDLGIITSSTGLVRMTNFNKNLFRFVRGVNNLSISGSISNLQFKYQLAKKVGG